MMWCCERGLGSADDDDGGGDEAQSGFTVVTLGLFRCRGVERDVSGRREVLVFSDPPFLDFRAAVCSTRAGERNSNTERTNTRWKPNLSSPWRSASPSTAACVSPVSQLPGHAQTPRLKLRDADVSFFLENLLRIGENMKQQLWKQSPSAYAGLISDTLARLKRPTCREPRGGETRRLETRTRSFSVNHTFWNWKLIIFWHVSITQVGLGARSHPTYPLAAFGATSDAWLIGWLEKRLKRLHRAVRSTAAWGSSWLLLWMFPAAESLFHFYKNIKSNFKNRPRSPKNRWCFEESISCNAAHSHGVLILSHLNVL